MVDQNSQFYAILTKVGAAKQANADALGIPWKITHMAVGDASPAGLDNPPLPMPDASWTSLLNEWRRAPLNQLKVDEKDSAVIVAEQVIPAEIGGRWIREVGLYDADGDLVAVANCAPTYKPLLNQGSGRTQVVRMNLVVSSASNVQLKIDPGVVLATREFVTEELAKRDFKHSVLAATTAAITLSGLQTMDGVALQAGARVLVKNQAAAKDNGLYLVASGAWTRCPDADSSAKVTPGLLVLVERGTANGDSAWQLTTDAPITLGVTALAFEMAFGRSGVAAGTYRSVKVDAYGRVVAATNPTTLSGYGITDSYTKAQIEEMIAEASAMPVGVMAALPVNKIPPGWLEVDNSAKSIAAYPDLAAFLGGAYNNGTEPAGYFRLPESRGAALRGWDHGRGIDVGRALGDEQLDAMQRITGKFGIRGAYQGGVMVADQEGAFKASSTTTAGFYVANGSTSGAFQGTEFDTGLVARTASETRMRNVSVVWCIKAWSAPINQGNIDIAALAALAAQATETNLGMVRIATQAQVNAGLADDVLVTPKKLRWGLTASFTTNGYLVFPSWLGGFTVQWGALSGNAGVRDLNFPLEFPSSVLQLMLTGQASQATVGEYNDQWVNSLSKSGAVIYAEAAQSIRWLALGR
ncbi:phage tail protein [Pseudomonas sp. SD17-1]|uniref:phage tail-collar fiber domain-containing protein n=1 Tax=Pseudomonas TaxID=286 RepID=UPI000C283042|nr:MULTISPECIES: phage tail protein [Pseudomonas]MCQ0166232.1 phage tail protein [Pseudomonas sp. S12(2018)]WEJ22907.1 phage tail protein [Pseudomonas sp. SD17-1]